MPGIGSIASIAGALGESGVMDQAKEMAVAQIGAQAGAKIADAPTALMRKLGTAERFVQSPNGFGRTPIDGWFPEFHHTIFVGVSGGPDAELKRIWQLAVSAAFGRLRQRISTFAGVQVECIWDVTDKTVGIRISYGSNGLIPVLLAGLGVNGESAVEIIQRGPSSETIGGNWSGFLKTYKQLLNKGGTGVLAMGGRIVPFSTGTLDNPTTPGKTSRSGILQRDNAYEPDNSQLPDDGRLITTAMYTDPQVQPPRPTDYTDYVSIVSNALSAPCYLPCKPGRGLQVDDPQGKRFYSAGNTALSERSDLVKTAEDQAQAANNTTLPLGLDGVPSALKEEVPEVPDECTVFTTNDLRGGPTNG